MCPDYGSEKTNYKERFDAKQVKRARRNFKRSDGYKRINVIRNGVDLGLIDIHIFNIGIEGRSLKEFVSHPDQHILYGDIIVMEDFRQYLVYRQDWHEGVNTFGKIEYMLDSFKFIDKGEVVNIPYFVESYGLGSQDPTNRIPVSKNRKVIWTQKNDDTKKIFVNQRFILGDQSAFKCTYIDDFSTPNIIVFTFEAEERHEQDDLTNRIAYNGDIDIDNEQDEDAEATFSLDKLSIRLNQTGSVSVSNELSQEFTFRIDNVPPSAYEIIASDGNSITIKALAGGYTGLLVAINDVTTTETSIPIELRSLF